MTQPQRYIVAGSIFAVVVGVFAFPYLQARLRPITPTPSSTPSSVSVEGEPQLSEPNHLSIPVLGIEAPVIYVEEKSETVYQTALKNGVVHYPGTAKPGELGNAYIFGHSSDYVWSAGDFKTVFAKLPQIEMGTEIFISNENGEMFTYLVTETKVVGPRDLSVLDQNEYQDKQLTIQTSYPLGTALQRYIVISELKVD